MKQYILLACLSITVIFNVQAQQPTRAQEMIMQNLGVDINIAKAIQANIVHTTTQITNLLSTLADKTVARARKQELIDEFFECCGTEATIIQARGYTQKKATERTAREYMNYLIGVSENPNTDEFSIIFKEKYKLENIIGGEANADGIRTVNADVSTVQHFHKKTLKGENRYRTYKDETVKIFKYEIQYDVNNGAISSVILTYIEVHEVRNTLE
jgi:hypothetical protein